MSPTVKSVLRRLEVKHDGDVYADRPPTRWGNRDIWPVPIEQRRFNAVSYWSFWSIALMGITGWSYGGGVIAIGLSPTEAMGATAAVSAICAGVAYSCGHHGSHMHLG